VGAAVEADWNSLWTAGGMVPDKVPAFPDSKLNVVFSSGVTITPNDSVTTDKLLELPKATWATEPGALYTFLIVDVDVVLLSGKAVNFIHFLATNIPGDDVAAGTQNFGYIPPFAFLFTNENGLSKDPAVNHRYALLVFKQQGQLNVTVEEKTCSPKVLARAKYQSYQDFVKEHGLGNAVAGNFLRAVYGDGAEAHKWICFFSKCTGHPFPAPIKGVNDGPDCQPEGGATAPAHTR
jgi:hypothetical protein